MTLKNKNNGGKVLNEDGRREDALTAAVPVDPTATG